MKIFVLGINFYPELIGISVYTTEMCEYLRDARHKVVVFTAFPYYPQWKIDQKYRRKIFMSEDYQGVKIRRSYVYVPRKVTTKTRILHELSFIISSFFNLLSSGKPDIMIVISPPLGLGLISIILSKIKRIPFIFHVQDLQPDASAELGMLKNKRFLGLFYKIEKMIYSQAIKVSVISEKMGEKIISKGVEQEKILFFPNWVNTDFIKPLSRINKFRKDNGIKNEYIVLYSGNIGLKQGLETILEVANGTKDTEDILYFIVGNGAYREEFIRKHTELGLKNVKYLPVQSREILPYMLSASDVCLIPQQRRITDIVMPSKLTGIMASGRPVIAGANVGSELYRLIKNAQCGIIVEPENPKQMLGAIMKIYSDQAKGKEYGRRGREYAVRYFSKEVILGSFEKKIREITY